MDAVAQWTMLIYGVLLIVGGLAGYVRAGSRISLLSGGVSGCVILLAFWLGFRSIPLAFSIGGIVAAVLMITMGIRFLRTGHILPAGLIAMMSLVILVVLLLAVLA